MALAVGNELYQSLKNWKLIWFPQPCPWNPQGLCSLILSEVTKPQRSGASSTTASTAKNNFPEWSLFLKVWHFDFSKKCRHNWEIRADSIHPWFAFRYKQIIGDLFSLLSAKKSEVHL